MNVLITGGAGYIGSVITNIALQRGYKLKVIDKLWFNKKIPLIYYNHPNYEFIKGDICDLSVLESIISEVDYVIHAAAVVGDPASKKFPDLCKKINEEAAINLINICQKKKVKGLIFLSTCSNYGIANGLANEDDSLNPLSLYAETKVNVEKYILNQVKHVDWIICRLSTVYGSSPRMRFDLTVNDFTLKAVKDKYVDIFLPESYRPYVHVFDLANILMDLIDNFKNVKNNVFNVGFPGENYKKIAIAEYAKDIVKDLNIDILKEGGDNRDYKVDFSKLSKHLKIGKKYNVYKSMIEISHLLKNGIIDDPDNHEYYNTSPSLE